MPPVLRSDSDDDQGRVRAATYPPRPARAFSHHRVGRDEWCAKSLDGHRNTPPVELGGDKKIFSLLKLKKPVNKIVLNRKAARSEGISGWSTKKGFVTPTSCESGSATSRSGATSRGPRRRHRKGWEDVAAAPTRQQRLVTAMFALVIVLASVQIIALVVHPPGEDKYRTRGLAASGQAATLGGAGGGVDGMGDGILKRTTGGFRANFLRSSGDGGGNVLAPVARDVGGRAFSGGEQQHGLSLSNPRAFEMVAADMGNLKDTVSRRLNKPQAYKVVSTAVWDASLKHCLALAICVAWVFGSLQDVDPGVTKCTVGCRMKAAHTITTTYRFFYEVLVRVLRIVLLKVQAKGRNAGAYMILVDILFINITTSVEL